MTIRWMIAVMVAASVAAGAHVFAQAHVRPAPGPLFRRPGVPTCGADTAAQLQSRTDAFDAVTEITTAAHVLQFAPVLSEVAGARETAAAEDPRFGADARLGSARAAAGLAHSLRR